MNIRLPKRILFIPLLALTQVLGFAPSVLADDTEVFFNSPASLTSAARPKVLIVFDDSGSMITNVRTRRPYDPNATYNGGIDGTELDRVYYSTDGEPPDDNSPNWFSSSVNRCISSDVPLREEGIFNNATARRWQPEVSVETCAPAEPPQCPSGFTYHAPGDECRRRVCPWFCFWQTAPRLQQCTTEQLPGSWRELSSAVNNPPHVECKNDSDAFLAGNGPGVPVVADGFPLNNVPDADVFAGTDPDAADQSFDWGGQQYTLFSGHYVDYWNDESDSAFETARRIDIAEDVISDLVANSPGYDIGLMLFNSNRNSSTDGGRLVSRIRDNMTEAERTALVNLIDNDLVPDGSTPLCESYYEAYRYFSGKSVQYGLESTESPARDTNVDAEVDGVYVPPSQDCGPVYAILMTDGEPQNDTNANAAIEALTGKTCSTWDSADSSGSAKNCLPELAEYMATQDIDQNSANGEQNAITYAIGFNTEQDLLEQTALNGTGKYYEARSAGELATVFRVIFNDIADLESTFTSPAVSVDSFSQTRSRDVIYYAMFEPDNRPDWRGNVKKLQLSFPDDEEPLVVDRNGDPAFNAGTGDFLNDIDTFWSTDDGGTVRKGGVGGLLLARDPATRTIYTNTGAGGALEAFDKANLTADAFGFPDDASLFAAFEVSGQDSLDELLDWARGFPINPDGSVSDTPREWIMGDPLHSQPTVLNYGALGGFDPNNPDLRILVGTNSGFLHMFGDTDGEEDWAFFPKELASVLNVRRINAVSPEKVYGIDLTPVAYTEDVGLDGTISAADGDRLWVYQGLRRGGRILYALDLSNPDSPSFMWQANSQVDVLEEMGQTWSEPVVTKIPGHVDGTGAPKPVVIFGAGYDPNKDSTAIGSADSEGRGVFILDAQDGSLVRSITPAARTDDNLTAAGLTDSVPGAVEILDSNGDGLTDRLYFGDTGGNVWRVDINPGLPDFDDGETWHFTQLARLGGGAVANDRRFFNRPDVVRIRGADGRPVDAVLIGSGDRTNPLATDVTNFFYNLWDEQVGPYTTPEPTTAECVQDPNDPQPVDFRCKLPITGGSTGTLFDITNQTLNDTNLEGLTYIPNGWELRLTGLGEKSLADSRTLLGVVQVPTYTPPGVIIDAESCSPVFGTGLLRLVDLYSGQRTEIALGPIIPDTMAIVVGPGPKDDLFYGFPPGAPPGDGETSRGIGATGQSFPGPYGNFWYREDY